MSAPWERDADIPQTKQEQNAENFLKESRNYVVRFFTFVERRPIISVIFVLLLLNFFQFNTRKSEPTNTAQTSESASNDDVVSSVAVNKKNVSAVSDIQENCPSIFQPGVNEEENDKNALSEPASLAEEKPETQEEKIYRLFTVFYDLSLGEKERKEAREELDWLRNDKETAELVDSVESAFLVKDFKETPNAETVPDGTILECSTHEELLRQNHKTIKKLVLKGSSIDSHAFALLQRTPHLQELSLYNINTAHRAYEYLKSCVNLTSLKIVGGNFGDEDLKYIADLPNLKTLDVSKANVSVDCLETFPDYKNIDNFIFPDSLNNSVEARVKLLNVKSNRSENIDLSGYAVDDSILRSLDPRSDVKTLKLSKTKITSSSFEHIAKFEGLRELDLSNTSINDQDAEALNDLVSTLNLKTLSLQDCDSFKEDGMVAFTNYKKLENFIFPDSLRDSVRGRIVLLNMESNHTENVDLSTESSVDDDAFEYLNPRSDIKTLNLSHTQITSKSFARLAKFEGLYELDLSYTSIKNSDAEALNSLLLSLPLKTLSLQGCDSFDENGIELLTNGTNLEELLIPNVPIAPEKEYFNRLKAPILRGIEKNGVLNLSGSKLDDSVLEQFASLEGLTQVILSNCLNLECVPLQNFQSGSTVKTLDLSGTNVSDSALENLTPKFSALNALVLQGCSQLTDESIRSLPLVEKLDLREINKLTLSGLLPNYRVNNLQFDDVKKRKQVIDALHRGNLTLISTDSGVGYEDLSAQDVAVIANDTNARKTLEKVDLADCSDPVEILGVLSKFENLKELSLVSCEALQNATKGDAKLALERAALIPNLETLDISDWNAPVEVVEPLQKSQTLDNFVFPDSYKTDEGFAYCYSIPKLQNREKIDLSSWNTSGRSIIFAVENLKRLNTLKLNDQVVDSDLSPLTTSETLQSLNLARCKKITREGIFTVLDIPNLSRLDIPSDFTKYQAVIDAGLKSDFVAVEFDNADYLTDESLEILAAPRFKRSTERLVLKDAKYLLDKATSHIANLTNLKSLTLTNARQRSGNRVYGILNDSLQKLGALRNLEELNIEGLHPDDDDSGLEFLKNMPKLRKLEGATLDSEQEIACIAGTSIARFELFSKQKTYYPADNIIKYLGQMKNLETLVISDYMGRIGPTEWHGGFSSGLSSKGLAPLAQAPKLRNLFLCFYPDRKEPIDFSVLKGCKNLETLCCCVNLSRKSNQGLQSIRQIGEIKTLKRLGFFASNGNYPLDAQGCQPLLGLTNLEVLALGYMNYVVDSPNDPICSLPDLKTLQANKIEGERNAILQFKSKIHVIEERKIHYEILELLDNQSKNGAYY